MWGGQIHMTKFWTGNYSSNVTTFELRHRYHENITNIMYYTVHRFWGTLSYDGYGCVLTPNQIH